jgi:hypothetical protein
MVFCRFAILADEIWHEMSNEKQFDKHHIPSYRPVSCEMENIEVGCLPCICTDCTI